MANWPFNSGTVDDIAGFMRSEGYGDVADKLLAMRDEIEQLQTRIEELYRLGIDDENDHDLVEWRRQYRKLGLNQTKDRPPSLTDKCAICNNLFTACT